MRTYKLPDDAIMLDLTPTQAAALLKVARHVGILGADVPDSVKASNAGGDKRAAAAAERALEKLAAVTEG